MVYAKSLMKLAGRQKSSSFDEGKGDIRKTLDRVLIGAPPVERVSDPTILATQSDGDLLVMDAQDIRKRPLRDTMHSLKTVDAKVLDTGPNSAKGGKYDQYGYRNE